MIVPYSYIPSSDASALPAAVLEMEQDVRVQKGWEQPPSLLIKAISDPGPQAAMLVGKNGMERLRQFLRVENGWDFGRGRRLSRVSVALLKVFVERYGSLVVKVDEPSLYLDSGGYLRLEWDLTDGGELAIDFPAVGESIVIYLERPGHDITEASYHLLDNEHITHILETAGV